MDFVKQIKDEKRKLADLIRSYSISQKEIWQRIPYLALLAHKKNKNSDYQFEEDFIFKHGLLPIGGFVPGQYHYALFVDCASGNLVCITKKNHVVVSAKRKEVLEINIEKINAQEIADKFAEEIKMGDVRIENFGSIHFRGKWFRISFRTPVEWRKKVAKVLKLKKNFTRKSNKIVF